MDFAEQLRVLKAAKGDRAKLALATVDLAYPALPEAERALLKKALEAAAIPHWFDEAILAALLDIAPEVSATHLARLGPLTVVESFPARGKTALNVHEATRLALRKHLAAEAQERFRALSARAAMRFASDITPAGRIEWIYHLLCADPERGADELGKMTQEWSVSAHPEDRFALAGALSDLEQTKLAKGAARAEILLCVAATRSERGETSQLEGPAKEALALARTVKRPFAIAQANCLLADVLQVQGRLADARSAFQEFLKISRLLAKQDPRNTAQQRELAAAHSRVGEVSQAQGKLAEAQRAFQEGLKILRRLVKKDRSNVDSRTNLARAYSLMGQVLREQGKLAGTQRAFQECLKICRWLVKQDPRNAGLQGDLSGALSLAGILLKERGKLAEAQSAFREELKISRQLAKQDPSNADRQKTLAKAYLDLGDIFQAQGKLAEARKEFRQYLGITVLLAEQGRTDTGRQRELAVAHGRVGGMFDAQGKQAKARTEFQKSLEIIRRLAKMDQSDVGLQRELATLLGWVASCEEKAGHYNSALPLREKAVRVYGELAVKAPGFAKWATEMKTAESDLAHCRLMVETDKPSGTARGQRSSASASPKHPPSSRKS